MSTNRNAFFNIIESKPFLELKPELEPGHTYRVFHNNEDSKKIAQVICNVHFQIVVLLKKIEKEIEQSSLSLNLDRKLKKVHALKAISHAIDSCGSTTPNIPKIVTPDDLQNLKKIIEDSLNNKDITSGIISTRTKDTLSRCLEITNDMLTQFNPDNATFEQL